MKWLDALRKHLNRRTVATLTVATVLASGSTVVLLGAPAWAWPAPVHGPQYQVVYNYTAPIPDWVTWTGDNHLSGRDRISSHANGDVIWQSMGMYFQQRQCQFVRILYLDRAWPPNVVRATPAKFVCGGGLEPDEVDLDLNAPANTAFYIQCWADTRAERHQDEPCAGSFTF